MGDFTVVVFFSFLFGWFRFCGFCLFFEFGNIVYFVFASSITF